MEAFLHKYAYVRDIAFALLLFGKKSYAWTNKRNLQIEGALLIQEMTWNYAVRGILDGSIIRSTCKLVLLTTFIYEIMSVVELQPEPISMCFNGLRHVLLYFVPDVIILYETAI